MINYKRLSRKRKLTIALCCLLVGGVLNAQQRSEADSIPLRDVSWYLNILAGDSLEGRGNLQPGLLKAAEFIGTQFTLMGLKPYPGSAGFYHPFSPVGGPANEMADNLKWNGRNLKKGEFRWMNPRPGLYNALPLDSFEVVQLDRFDSTSLVARNTGNRPLCLWTNAVQKFNDQLMNSLLPGGMDPLKRPVLLVFSKEQPVSLALAPNAGWYEKVEYNVIAMLPGTSDETIILSAHYDHEGVVDGRKKADRILNGANDDASGTTAVLAIAAWLSGHPGNKRTIVFAAFTAEEIGLLGSQYFATTHDLTRVKANINLEMLGIPEFGAKTVMVTGKGQSWLHRVLAIQLQEDGLRYIDDPLPDRMLYERSDNFSFVARGVPANTIMGSTDDDPCYHQPCDEVKRIDMQNLTGLINAIRHTVSDLLNRELLQ